MLELRRQFVSMYAINVSNVLSMYAVVLLIYAAYLAPIYYAAVVPIYTSEAPIYISNIYYTSTYAAVSSLPIMPQ